MSTKPSKNLETFPNPHPGRDYIIEIECPEFTCLCPKTGQPDFATLFLEYVPDQACVELKALKLYLWSFRDEGHFHEDVTNRILNDLVRATSPRYMRLTAAFFVRGGIYTTVVVEHRKNNAAPPPPPPPYPREVQELPARDLPPGAPTLETPTHPAGALADEVPSSRFRMLRRARRPEPPAAPVPQPERSAQPPPAPEPPPAPKRPEPVFVGIDIGTSGVRLAAIDAEGRSLAHAETPIPIPSAKDGQINQDPTRWWKAVNDGLAMLLRSVDPQAVRAIAVSGISGTLLLTDTKGSPITPAIMYNDKRAAEQAQRLAQIADADSGAQGTGSSLAKLLWFQDRGLDKRAAHALHPADWVAGRLCGNFGHSDYNNCLKLGFDPQRMEWPAWFASLPVSGELLPQVHAPGDPLGTVSAEIAKTFNFASDTTVIAGTTDGVASFVAAGAAGLGEAVTALGSTLVLKLLSDKPVFAAEYGLYSHKLGRYWLAGGASNSGGAALLQYFKVEQMREMTPLLDPEKFTGLDYYPLPDVGERFPINDPTMIARLEPLPGDSIVFFQGMLEGIARIESMGYNLLRKLGAPPLKMVWTTGGGSQNPAWERLRARVLGVPVRRTTTATAYGTALLAAGLAVKTYQ